MTPLQKSIFLLLLMGGALATWFIQAGADSRFSTAAPHLQVLRDLVRDQVTALRQGDFQTASSLAHEGFPTSAPAYSTAGRTGAEAAWQQFLPIMSSESISFRGVHETRVQILLEVLLKSPQGLVTPAVYTLAPDAEGTWKIRGIQFQKSYRDVETRGRMEI